MHYASSTWAAVLVSDFHLLSHVVRASRYVAPEANGSMPTASRTGGTMFVFLLHLFLPILRASIYVAFLFYWWSTAMPFASPNKDAVDYHMPLPILCASILIVALPYYLAAT